MLLHACAASQSLPPVRKRSQRIPVESVHAGRLAARANTVTVQHAPGCLSPLERESCYCSKAKLMVQAESCIFDVSSV